MTKKMLISVTEGESQVAVVEDTRLQELVIEQDAESRIKGNIYKGCIKQVHVALQAAFIEFGDKQQGFLPLRELNSMLFPENESKRQIQHLLKEGMWLMVQVVRDPLDHKGAALTTNISIAGRYMVFLPYTKRGGISKKIQGNDERERLKSFLSSLEDTKHTVIIRTAGLDRDLEELKKDYLEVQKEWEKLLLNYQKEKDAGLILPELDIVTKTLRDYYVNDTDEIWVDNPTVFQTVLQFLKTHVPRKQKTLKLFVGERSLFASYNIEKEVEQLTSPTVRLPSGGELVIEQTEALVSIDVNSAKSSQESSLNKTAFRTNMEAAKEVARQLRLRNLGGLIVIDFIDMSISSERSKVEDTMEQVMDRDKAQHNIGKISEFGLLELSRQRLTTRISNVVETICPICKGKGKVPSVLSVTNTILRTLRELAVRGDVDKISGPLPLEQANYLLNEKRQAINDLELEFGMEIMLEGKPQEKFFHPSHLNVIYRSDAKRDDVSKNKKQFNLKSGKTVLDSYESSFESDFLSHPLEAIAGKNQKSVKQKLEHNKKIDKVEKQTTVDSLVETKLQKQVAEKIESKSEKEAALVVAKPTNIEKRELKSEKDKALVIAKSTNNEEKQANKQDDSFVTVDEITVTREDITEKLERIFSEESVEKKELIPLYEGCLYTKKAILTEEKKEQAVLNFQARLQGKADGQKVIVYDQAFIFPFIDDIESHSVIDSEASKTKASETTSKTSKAKASPSEVKANESVSKTNKAKAKSSEVKANESVSKTNKAKAKSSEVKPSEIVSKTSKAKAKPSEVKAKSSETKNSETVAKINKAKAKPNDSEISETAVKINESKED